MSLDEQIREHLENADHEDWCDACIHADCGKDCNCFLGRANEALRQLLDICRALDEREPVGRRVVHVETVRMAIALALDVQPAAEVADHG